MNRTKSVIFLAFLLAMGAGVAVGMLGSRSLPSNTTPGHDASTWLANELQLTPDQQQKMNRIWSEMLASKGRQYGEQFRALQQQREAAIAALMTEQQQVQCNKLNEEYAGKWRDLWKRMEQDFSAAADKTRQLLNDTQRKRYDALLEKFHADHASPDWLPGASKALGRAPTSGPAPEAIN